MFLSCGDETSPAAVASAGKSRAMSACSATVESVVVAPIVNPSRALPCTPAISRTERSPTTLETPEIHTILVETDDPEGPFGAKEAGQGPLLPVIPAIVNAVYDAVGVRIDEIPVTPEKILRALDLARQGKTPRVGPEKLPLFTFKEPLVVESAFGQPADAIAVRPFSS